MPSATNHRKPTTPRGLKARGSKLWRSVTSTYELRPDELVILEDAAREADLVDRLHAQLGKSELVVKGSMGQDVASPLVQEIRQHRTVFAGLMAKLKLPDEPAGAEPSTSSKARDAAAARWQRGA